MTNLPFGFGPSDPDEHGENTPFGQGGENPFGAGAFDFGQLGQMLSQLGQMLSQAGSVHLAEQWLDPATALPAGAIKAEAWSARDWVERTLQTWQRLCDPVARQVSGAWVEALPAEAKEAAGPLLSIVSQMGGMAFGSQLGGALAQLGSEVLTSTEVGLPLGPEGTAALLPANIEKFTAGLERPADEVMLFLAAREAAHHRLFTQVPWLRQRLLATVEEFAHGIKVDTRTPSVTGCRARARCARPSAGAGPAADRPSRRSPPSSAWNCGRAGCGPPRRSGGWSATGTGSRCGTASGPHPIWCPPRPTWTNRSTSPNTSASCRSCWPTRWPSWSAPNAPSGPNATSRPRPSRSRKTTSRRRTPSSRRCRRGWAGTEQPGQSSSVMPQPAAAESPSR